jgi:hypothetical protein
MIRSRASALTFATTFVGASVLSGVLAMPLAHADPLDAIRSAVNGNRSATACGALTYSGALEGAAQAYARSENPVDGQPAGYNGRTLAFLGSGDPQADAINSAYKRGAGGLISNCDFTEFGVGFVRHEDREVDVVTIVFGAPPKAAPVVVPDTPKDTTVTCPAGSPTATVVPPATCAPVPAALPDPNSVTMTASGAGLGKVNVSFKNSSDVLATCQYTASPSSNPLGVLPTINKTVKVNAKGSGALNGEPAPPPLVSYHLSANCTGIVNGSEVPLGNPETDVSG